MGRILTKEELTSLEEGNSIAIIWGIADVYGVATTKNITLTEEEAKEVLYRLVKYHDANEGISWITLSTTINLVVAER